MVKIHGQTHAFFEQGMTRSLPSVCSFHIPGYHGLFTLESGDLLTVMQHHTDQILWQGLITSDHIDRLSQSSTSNPQLQLDSMGTTVSEWLGMFYNDHKAVLIPSNFNQHRALMFEVYWGDPNHIMDNIILAKLAASGARHNALDPKSLHFDLSHSLFYSFYTEVQTEIQLERTLVKSNKPAFWSKRHSMPPVSALSLNEVLEVLQLKECHLDLLNVRNFNCCDLELMLLLYTVMGDAMVKSVNLQEARALLEEPNSQGVSYLDTMKTGKQGLISVRQQLMQNPRL